MNKIQCVFVICVAIIVSSLCSVEADARQQNIICEPWGGASVSYYNGELYISNGEVYLPEGQPWFYPRPIRQEPEGMPPVMGPIKKVYFNNVTFNFNDLSQLFKGHKQITEVDLSGVKINGNPVIDYDIDTGTYDDTVNFDEMFMDCPLLEKVTLSNDMAKKASSTKKMFKGATSLNTFDMGAFSNKLIYTREMFSGANKLKKVTDFDYSNIKDASYMFKDTKNLDYLNVSTVPFVDKKDSFNNFLQGSGIKSFSMSDKNPQIRGMNLPDGSWYTPDLAKKTGGNEEYGKYLTTENLIRKADSELVLSGLKDSKPFATYFKGITYTIAYNSNDSSNKKVKTNKIYTEEEYTITSPTEISSHAKIVSWNTKKDGSGTEYLPGQVIKNLTNESGKQIELYAQYNSEPYTIKYNANIDQVSGSMKDELIEVDQEYVIKDSGYSKEGYKFSYWTTTKEDIEKNRLYKGNKVVNLANPSEEVTLYAQWTPINYEIIYNDEDEIDLLSSLGNDRFNLKNGPSSYSQRMIYDVEEKLLPIKFAKKGYSNKYWKNDYANSDITFENNSSVKNLAKNEGDLVLMYTDWRAHKYNVAFDSNGGTGYMSSIDCIYDESTKLPKETFTRKNYIFSGWSTKPSDNTPEFKSEEVIQNLTDKDLDQITLYAVWKKDRITDDIID